MYGNVPEYHFQLSRTRIRVAKSLPSFTRVPFFENLKKYGNFGQSFCGKLQCIGQDGNEDKK